jgi:hypothetical protein
VDILILACGRMRHSTLEDRNAGSSEPLQPLMSSEATIFGTPMIRYAGGSPDLTRCSYALLRTGGGPLNQVILRLASRESTQRDSGARRLYSFPAIRPLGLPINLNGAAYASPRALGGEVTMRNVPPDLLISVASPQLPDSGVPSWPIPNMRSDYRIFGELLSRSANQQRYLFFSGALAGISGGALVWALQLGATTKETAVDQTNRPVSGSQRFGSPGNQASRRVAGIRSRKVGLARRPPGSP